MLRFATRTLTAVACLLILAVTACDDPGPSAPDPAVHPAFERVPDKLTDTDEGQAVLEIAELVARSLEDATIRQQVKRAMRDAPHLEHKLAVGPFLQSPAGGVLLSAMARNGDRNPSEVMDLLRRVRPLEMYMPVDRHRETWTGTPDVVVATLLDDHTIPAGFRTSGEPYRFESAEEAPDVPVLAVVPRETNFDRPIDRSKFENVDDAGGRAVGSYRPASTQVSAELEECGPQALRDCSSGGGGGGTDWSSYPTGVYMTKVHIPDDYEGFAKGDPEFETHLQAPMDDPSVAEDLWCAAESEASSGFSFYNQDDSFFEGPVLVADSATHAEFVSRYGTDDIGMSVVSWEDDDTRCEIKADEDRLENMIEAVAAAYPSVSSVIADVSVGGVLTALPVAKEAVMAIASWLKSNDDVIGTRVEEACSLPDGTTGNWVIKDGTTTTGCSELKWHDQSDYQ